MRILRYIARGIGSAFLASIVLLVATQWSKLPAEIPTHFNAAGDPDGYGPKSALLLMAGVASSISLFLAWIERRPSSLNYPIQITDEKRSALHQLGSDMILALNFGINTIFLYLVYAMIETAAGRRDGLGVQFLPLMLLVTILVPAYFFVQMYRLRNAK
jgi:uncharacterized membrane protein